MSASNVGENEKEKRHEIDFKVKDKRQSPKIQSFVKIQSDFTRAPRQLLALDRARAFRHRKKHKVRQSTL
jgi:hypothetical protein